MNKRTIWNGMAVVTLLGAGAVQAAELEWANTLGDNDFANSNNFTFVQDFGYDFLNVSLTGADRAIMSSGSNVVSDIRVGIYGDGELEVTGGYLACNRGSGDTRFGQNGWDALVNMSGGYWKIGQDLAVGLNSASEATFNLSGGEVRNDGGKFTVGEVGVGRMEISGGSFGTRGYADIFGTGTFAVHGSNATSITIGTYASNDSYWNQRNGATLEIRLDDNGVTPIHILDYDTGGGNATFAFGALLDVDFAADATPVSNTWTVMNWEGATDDQGIQFSTNVDFNVWSFEVTNNALTVTYGESSAPPSTNLPPTVARNLYWIGGAGTTDPTDALNWATNTAGDVATWGIFDNDTLRVGDYHVMPDVTVTSVVDYVGGTSANQNNLLIGERRAGIFNINSGDLNFSSGCSGLGHGSSTGYGELNLNGGSLYLKYYRAGLSGASGAFNVNGGAYTSGSAIRVTDIDGNTVDAGAFLGYGGVGYAELNVSGGSYDSRFGIILGQGGSTGRVHVEGSEATSFGFGTVSGANGFWFQNEGSTLSCAIDEGGITPIVINDGGGTKGVRFGANTVLQVGWAAGVTNYGVFDVMSWNGNFEDNGLSLDPSADTNIWSFVFDDDDNDGTNDMLRVIADPGVTDNGTSILWLMANGLTEEDEFVDNDSDGLLTWEEYVAGTIPTNSSSVLEVNSMLTVGDDYIVTWQSVEGKSYSIVTNLNLTVGTPGTVKSGIVGMPVETSYTGTISGASAVFYEIEVQ